MLSVKRILHNLENSYPNVYIVVMMLFFILFFESVSRIYTYLLPDVKSDISLWWSIGAIVLVVYVFTAQDKKLNELQLNNDSNVKKSAVATLISARS